MSDSVKGWTSPNGVVIDIQPFMSSGWTFSRLRMTEVVGGKIAEGEISLQSVGSDKSLEIITKVNNFTIDISNPNGGQTYKIHGFITSKNWTKTVMDIKFLCIPSRKFFSEPLITLQDDPETALKLLWGSNNGDTLDLRCKSDLNNEVKLQQLGESNYKACKKLAMSFKKNSIFCFGLEGFMIKDIVGINSKGKKEPECLVLGDGEVNQTSGFNMNYEFKLYKNSQNPWTDDEDYAEKKQHSTLTALTINDEYYLVSQEHFGLLGNYLHNRNLMESRFHTSLTILTPNTLPNFKIGDTIKYRRSTDSNTNPFELFFVSKMSYFISSEGDKDENGLQFSVSSILRGIGDKGQEFSMDDSRFDN